jgi:hypothetical protein
MTSARVPCPSLDPVNAGDVRVIERCEDLSFTLETCEPVDIGRERVRQYFERDVALKPRVACTIDLTHAAGAKRRDDFIRAESSPGLKAHGWDGES